MIRATILLVAIVYLTSTMAQFRAPRIPSHTQATCYEKLCANSRDCRSQDERMRVFDACTRQLDTKCIDNSMATLSRYDQDDINEKVQIARSCQYVYSASQAIVFNNLSRYDRNDLSEVTYLNSRLWLAEPACLASAASRLSRYDFNDVEDIRRVTAQCTGTFNAQCFEILCKSKWDCNTQEEVINALSRCISGPSKQDRRRL